MHACLSAWTANQPPRKRREELGGGMSHSLGSLLSYVRIIATHLHTNNQFFFCARHSDKIGAVLYSLSSDYQRRKPFVFLLPWTHLSTISVMYDRNTYHRLLSYSRDHKVNLLFYHQTPPPVFRSVYHQVDRQASSQVENGPIVPQLRGVGATPISFMLRDECARARRRRPRMNGRMMHRD